MEITLVVVAMFVGAGTLVWYTSLLISIVSWTDVCWTAVWVSSAPVIGENIFPLDDMHAAMTEENIMVCNIVSDILGSTFMNEKNVNELR